jgi:hypothetical protein
MFGPTVAGRCVAAFKAAQENIEKNIAGGSAMKTEPVVVMPSPNHQQ